MLIAASGCSRSALLSFTDRPAHTPETPASVHLESLQKHRAGTFAESQPAQSEATGDADAAGDNQTADADFRLAAERPSAAADGGGSDAGSQLTAAYRGRQLTAPDPLIDLPEPLTRPQQAPLPEPIPERPQYRPWEEEQEPDARQLELEDVLASVDRYFPLIVAAEQERGIAAGNLVRTHGAFDLRVLARGASIPRGTFENDRFDLQLNQPLFAGGIDVFGGYRIGTGTFPVYYGDRLTADGGEFRGGVNVPLLRDRRIDRRRADVWQAGLTQAIAEPLVQQARINFFRDAARAYWNWAAAGAQFRISEALLRIAQERQTAFETMLARGAIDEFVVVDNRRVVVEREGFLVAAERRLQQTSFTLSLYLRDEQGQAIVPRPDQLPRNFQTTEVAAPDPIRIEFDIELALAQRPELARFNLLRERLDVERRWAQNQLKPALNFGLFASEDVGPGKEDVGIFALNRRVLETSLMLEVPVQRREALGRLQTAEAQMAQVTAELQFARDQVLVDVQDGFSALDRAHARLEFARRERDVSQLVAESETRRLELGDATLLEVNLRELAAAGAQSKVVDALADYYRAEADYRAALGWDAAGAVIPE